MEAFHAELEVAPRPCLREVSPYLPGRPIGEVRRELGLKNVIKLASNENPLGISPKALRVVRRFCGESYRYPEGSSPLLRRALARHLEVEASRIIIGNGSDELHRLVVEAFLSPGDEVGISRYGFIRFEQSSRLMGAKIVVVPMKSWRYDLRAMGDAITARTKILFVASPNNPTGTYNTRAEVKELLDRVGSHVLVVLDEAYAHYAWTRPDYPRSIPEFMRYPNLFVLRTFSKVYGLAGLRVGYGVGSPELIRLLDRVRIPFNVNLLGQAAAEASLEDEDFVRRSVRQTEAGKRILMRGFKELGLSALDSAANFVLVEVPSGQEFFQRLLREGIIVRPMDEYGLTQHLRISVGLPFENKKLLSKLARVLQGAKAEKENHRH